MREKLYWLFWMVVFSLGAVGVLMMGQAVLGCRSALSVNMKQYQCSTQVRNSNGTVDFKDCIKGDGTGDTLKSQGGEGDDRVDIDPAVGSDGENVQGRMFLPHRRLN